MTMTNREIVSAIRRNMTTARQHADAALYLAKQADVPDSIYFIVCDAADAFRGACQDCQPWWKNA